MQRADAAACARIGDVELMRQAGVRIAELVRRYASARRIAAFAGPGNNGGDAFAAAAELAQGFACTVYAAENTAPSAARADAIERARAAGAKIESLPNTKSAARAVLADCDLAIDGLFGTGARLPVGDAYAPLVAALRETSCAVVAIDVPTGIDAATGAVSDPAVRASATLALAALKPGLLVEPSRDLVGDLWCARIGIDENELQECSGGYAALDDETFLDLLPQRAPESDKRRSGTPLILAGSEQFPGAAILCALGAARAGAGYVTIATPAAAAPTLRAHVIEPVVIAFDDARPASGVVDELLDIAKRNSAIGVGPGLPLDERMGAIVRGLIERSTLPVVADASALFHFAKHLDGLRGKPLVVTPHESEFARLSGRGTVSPGERIARLREFVQRTGIVTLLKGRTTLIDDGSVLHLNTTGTNALATAGTGDVLTGMIATLLSQGLSPVDAARAGAYWHGLAGQRCARHRPVGVMAGDLPKSLAAALPSRLADRALTRVF